MKFRVEGMNEWIDRQAGCMYIVCMLTANLNDDDDGIEERLENGQVCFDYPITLLQKKNQE